MAADKPHLDHDTFMRLYGLPTSHRFTFILRAAVYNRADAEDLLQETASLAWRKFDTYQPNTKFNQWLYKIAYNLIGDYYQRARRNKICLSDEALAMVAGTAESVSHQAAEYLEILEQCLQKLPQSDREIIVRRYRQGATNRSLASALGLSESKFSRTLSRIHILLMTCIRRNLPETV